METISHSAFAGGADAFVVAGAAGLVVRVAGGFGSAVRVATGAAGLGGAEVGEGDAEGVGVAEGDGEEEGEREGSADVCDGTTEVAAGGNDTAAPSPSAGPQATVTPATSSPISSPLTVPRVRLPSTVRIRAPTLSCLKEAHHMNTRSVSAGFRVNWSP
ncbi:hypothetical protein ACFQ7B_34730 [Streptomyces erythrochromogenes]|uniref:hypothetical protein n=1 Tax=Streptomyces erythrochromogenes TaxID=285574 RepID=UPI0036972AD6